MHRRTLEWHTPAQISGVFPGYSAYSNSDARPLAWYESCSSVSVGFAKIGVFCLAAAHGACSAESGADGGGAGHGGKPDPPLSSVELGVPAGDDGLDFAPLDDGAVLKLQTFGQGGTHLFLGVRCVGYGKRAFVGFTLTNLTSGSEIHAPPPARPQLFYCHEDDATVCDLVPVTVMTGGLTEPDEERDGLVISIRAEVANQEGNLTGESTRNVALSTEDLLPLQ
jgi:hypothetical protein